MMQIYRLLFVLLCLLPGVSMAGNGATRTWQFEVSLDGSPIGFHRFELVESGDAHQLQSEASFDVRFLFRASSTELHAASDARAARWAPLSSLSAEGSDDSVMRAVERIRALLPGG